jgi:hypothetical protein
MAESGGFECLHVHFSRAKDGENNHFWQGLARGETTVFRPSTDYLEIAWGQFPFNPPAPRGATAALLIGQLTIELNDLAPTVLPERAAIKSSR